LLSNLTSKTQIVAKSNRVSRSKFTIKTRMISNKAMKKIKEISQSVTSQINSKPLLKSL